MTRAKIISDHDWRKVELELDSLAMSSAVRILNMEVAVAPSSEPGQPPVLVVVVLYNDFR